MKEHLDVACNIIGFALVVLVLVAITEPQEIGIWYNKLLSGFNVVTCVK